ncbi:MAG: hypothetical protein GWO16_12345, partial [Gammaproteobacteria bacterium]|nr:hypothetical protein [Gammaproteobacteria bacterium]
LGKEAGFPIGETIAVPQLEGGFLYFLLAMLLGIGLTWGIHRWAKARGRTVGDDTRLVIAVV